LRAGELDVDLGAGQHLLGLIGLADEVDRAGPETAHLVVGVVLGRQEDHGDIAQRGRLLEPAAHFEPVDAGHAHVEQDQFGRARLGAPQGQLAIGRLAHRVAGRAKQFGEQLERGRGVFDDEHLAGVVAVVLGVHDAVSSAAAASISRHNSG
jgi:hypothetical protein